MNVGKIFLRLCSSSSPVCAILHNSRRVDDLIERMIQGNITRDQMLMKIFHEEIPVLFDVVALLTRILPMPCFVTTAKSYVRKEQESFSYFNL